MEEKKALNNEEMNGVSGGVYRTVDTRKPMDAVVRSGPGMSYPQIASLKNGTQVNVRMDGRKPAWILLKRRSDSKIVQCVQRRDLLPGAVVSAFTASQICV